MQRATVRRAIVIAVACAVLTGTSACGGDETSDGAGDPGSNEGTSPGADETPSGDDATIPDDVCSLLTAVEVSTAVGSTVTLETGPSGDCEFSEEDPRGLSGSLGVVRDAATNGGYEGYVSGLQGTLKAPVRRDLAGLGDGASTYVGLPTMGGSEMLMGAGVVDRGEFLEQTTLSQARSMTADELDQVAEALLRLLDGKIA